MKRIYKKKEEELLVGLEGRRYEDMRRINCGQSDMVYLNKLAFMVLVMKVEIYNLYTIYTPTPCHRKPAFAWT